MIKDDELLVGVEEAAPYQLVVAGHPRGPFGQLLRERQVGPLETALPLRADQSLRVRGGDSRRVTRTQWALPASAR